MIKTVDIEIPRREMADFLRTRRARLMIEKTPLPRGNRRRVPGLRREEVAELAGIGVTWYTWLEQGRPVNVSAGTLQRISTALQLNSFEQTHLFQLAGHPVPKSLDGEQSRLLLGARQTIESLDPTPAYVLNPRWDLVAWNRGASDVFGDFNEVPEERRNIVWLTFTPSEFRKRMMNWEPFAHCVLAHFRADSSAYTNDPEWSELTNSLLAQSEEFRSWWAGHEVAWQPNFRNDLVHPSYGNLHLHAVNLNVQGPGQLKIVAYLPWIGGPEQS